MAKSKEKVITDNLDNIKEWIGQGMSMESIARTLKVSKQTLYKYVNLDDLDTIKNSREPALQNLENTMYRSACGYERTVIKHAKVKRTVYENGKKAEEWEEMVEYEEIEYIPPDTTAGIFLLKNWGGYMNEPRALELRKKELELNEKKVNAMIW